MLLIIVAIILVLYSAFHVTQSKPITSAVKVGKLTLSPLGCGTWGYGNKLLWGYTEEKNQQLEETYNTAINSKVINWFDTADSYGTGKLVGQSEKLLGIFSANRNSKGSNSKYYYATKLAPFPTRIGSGSMDKALDESMQRLQRPVDILQLHWPPVLQWQERNYLKSFCNAIDEGKATQLGMSNYGLKSLSRVYNICDKQYNQRIYSNQVQFSLLSRLPLDNGLYDSMIENGIQPISYSPLGLGLLTDKYTIDNAPDGVRGILFREYLPSIQPLLNELRSIAKYRKKTVSQVAINWNLSKGFLTLIGMRDSAQVTDNIKALGWTLTPAEIDVLDTASKANKKKLIQNPNQTG